VTVESFECVRSALKEAAGMLRDAGVDFLLGGGLACWARGGPPTEHDVDLILTQQEAEKAVNVVAAAGLPTERPPEGWLYKTWVEDVLVDLIFEPSGPRTPQDLLARADVLSVEAVPMKVMRATDVLITKLAALNEHHLAYESVLSVARPLREQIAWEEARQATAGSPYAEAFFFLAERLGIAAATPTAR
jgi:predicted nucleotidyltransferase